MALDKSFDPWTATEEEIDVDVQISSKNTEARLRVWQWSYAQNILELKTKVEAGDGKAILECISSLFTGGLVAPQWLGLAFNNCYNSVLGGTYLSWDDAFGKPHPRMTYKKRLEGKRRDISRMMKIGSFIGGQVNNNIKKPKAYKMASAKFDIDTDAAYDYYRRYLDFIRVEVHLTEFQIMRLREGTEEAVATK